ncbi:MAG: purine-binding chemotaxis protein CheW [Victivallales bacterium]|nr:purine-binding chemotaxis protein CheW [Victivallales bacterium]
MAYEEELNSILEEGIEGGDDSMKNRFLTFEVGDEFYGVEILYVTEIVSMQKVTEVPDVPDYIKGVINLRGQVIPVIDVRARFKLEAKEYDDRTCAIVVNVENAVIGLIVDSVDEVINIAEENIGPSPAISESQSCRFIKGMGRVDGNVIILLSVARLLNDDVLEDIATTGK